jgi:hypothetical protein
VLQIGLGQTALNSIVLDSSVPSNLTLINQVANISADVAGIHVQLNGDDAREAAFMADTYARFANATADLASIHAQLSSDDAREAAFTADVYARFANVTAQVANISADVAGIHVQLNGDDAREAAFQALVNGELASIFGQIKVIRADQAQMHKDLAALQARVTVDENNYKGLLIMWIVSVVLLFVMMAVGFYLLHRKMGQQVESISESIPLRPSRGYSYT